MPAAGRSIQVPDQVPDRWVPEAAPGLAYRAALIYWTQWYPGSISPGVSSHQAVAGGAK